MSKRDESPNFIVAKNVCRLRDQQKMTQEKLCELADVTRAYYQKIESGKGNVTLEYLDRVRRALKCQWSDLFRGLDEIEK